MRRARDRTGAPRRGAPSTAAGAGRPFGRRATGGPASTSPSKGARWSSRLVVYRKTRFDAVSRFRLRRPRYVLVMHAILDRLLASAPSPHEATGDAPLATWWPRHV